MAEKFWKNEPKYKINSDVIIKFIGDRKTRNDWETRGIKMCRTEVKLKVMFGIDKGLLFMVDVFFRYLPDSSLFQIILKFWKVSTQAVDLCGL